MDVPFFRLNPQLIEALPMNEIRDPEILDAMWLAKVYVYRNRDAMEEVVRLLESNFTNGRTPRNELSHEDRWASCETFGKPSTESLNSLMRRLTDGAGTEAAERYESIDPWFIEFRNKSNENLNRRVVIRAGNERKEKK